MPFEGLILPALDNHISGISQIETSRKLLMQKYILRIFFLSAFYPLDSTLGGVLFHIRKTHRCAQSQEGGIHEGSDLPDLRGAVVVRKVWLLPPVPSRFRAAGGHNFATKGRQSYSAFPGSTFLVPNTPEFKRGHVPEF